jgi:hypothetical protein
MYMCGGPKSLNCEHLTKPREKAETVYVRTGKTIIRTEGHFWPEVGETYFYERSLRLCATCAEEFHAIFDGSESGGIYKI